MFPLDINGPEGLVQQVPLPPGSVIIEGGPWHGWRLTNSGISLQHGLDQLRASGTIANFHTVRGSGRATHGHQDALDSDVRNFVDSDVYKWLEAVAWATSSGSVGEALLDEASTIIDSIALAQDDDGYLNTWFQRLEPETRFSDLRFGHELYCLGHLIQAGVAWNRVFHDRRLLEVAIRFAELVLHEFSATERVCGHPCVEMALVQLSRETADPRFGRLAATLIDRRGHGLLGQGRFGTVYYQDDKPYRDMMTLSGHAVRAAYLAAGAVDVAIETVDAGLLESAERQWRNVVARRTHITGGIGSRYLGEALGDDFEVAPDAAYCETCAAIGLVMWTWRLSLTRLDGSHGDLIERAIYNAIMSGVSADGRTFHYANPLEVRVSHPRQAWFEIACCPPNLMRLVAAMDQLVASESRDALHLHQFVPAQVTSTMATVRLTTGYPVDGGLNVEIQQTRSEPWTLSLRVPGWAQSDWSLAVNGMPCSDPLINGYARVHRSWKPGEVVTLQFPLGIRRTFGDHRTGLSGSVAVERGPIVYCLDEPTCAVGHPGSVALAADPDLTITPHTGQSIPGVEATVVDIGPATDWPYLQARQTPPGPTRRTRLIPFASAGNAGPGALKVWIPEAGPR